MRGQRHHAQSIWRRGGFASVSGTDCKRNMGNSAMNAQNFLQRIEWELSTEDQFRLRMAPTRVITYNEAAGSWFFASGRFDPESRVTPDPVASSSIHHCFRVSVEQAGNLGDLQ